MKRSMKKKFTALLAIRTAFIVHTECRHIFTQIRLYYPTHQMNSATYRNTEYSDLKEDTDNKNSSGSTFDVISKLCRRGKLKDAIGILHCLDQPDKQLHCNIFASILQGCASSEAVAEGKHVHGHIIKTGLGFDKFLGNHLVHMYGKCGCVVHARHMFDKIPKRNVVSWTAIIAGHVQNGQGEEAMKLFGQMRYEGVKPNEFTLASAVNACANLKDLEQGKTIHDHIRRAGFESNAVVRAALVDMYAKCGSLEDARNLFDRMPARDEFSWTSLIAGYAKDGHGDEALNLFGQMQREGIRLNHFTFSIVLSACAGLAGLEQGKQVHAHIFRTGFESNIVVASALVDMYAKCGSIDDACKVFDKISARNVVSWTAMIAGCAQHGLGKEALQLFEQMLLAGMKPNYITFVGVLHACNHAGLVDEGRHYFDSMTQEHGITPGVQHYTCMVDVLGRAGFLDEAEKLMKQIPGEPDGAVWGALLGVCTIHGNIELGKHAAERLLQLKQQVATTCVLLSNMYAADGRWDDVARVRKLMKENGVKKEPGCSWIQVKNRMHAFFVGDKLHPQKEEIYAMLEKLSGQMKEAGYVPNTNLVLHDVGEEQKEVLLRHHSKKLAIAFGLISTLL